MNIPKRFIATTARRLEASTSQVTAPQSVNGENLPPVIQRYIQRHLNAAPSTSSPTIIPNPFIAHQRSPRTFATPNATNGESSRSARIRIPPVISRRRQKQLLQYFPADHLPPSSKMETTTPSVQWLDPILGEQTITWSGSLPSAGRVGLYEGRKRMFKGHKHELRKVQRDKDTEERLKGMEKRIGDWKKSKVEARTSAKPALPF